MTEQPTINWSHFTMECAWKLDERVAADPTLGRTNSLRVEAYQALSAAGLAHAEALELAEKVTAERVGRDAWRRYVNSIKYPGRLRQTLQANGLDPAYRPVTPST